jgi:hypothetical protein
MAAKKNFSMRVAPDQSLLVLDRDATGRWPLVRLRGWWTGKPVSEVLEIPGWSAGDAKHIADIVVDLQVTPDGRYAVAFAGALWMNTSSFLLRAPKGYVERKPDTVITVVDLERWRVVTSVHTAAEFDSAVGGARIVSDGWMVLESGLGRSELNHGVYRYLDRMVSIPGLKSGVRCVSQRFSHVWRPAEESVLGYVESENRLACADLFRAVGVDSAEALEAMTYRGQSLEPVAVRRHMSDFIDVRLKESDRVQIWEAEGHEEGFFRWGEYPYYPMYAENPFFESSANLWYGLYDAHAGGLYELGRYDAKGQRQAGRTAGQMMCGDPSLDRKGSACGCRVVDVSEVAHDLLALCRTQRGDYDGTVRREWLAVFRSDDLTGVGTVDVTRQEETLEAIARGDGRAYVVTLEAGEKLGVYGIEERRVVLP